MFTLNRRIRKTREILIMTFSPWFLFLAENKIGKGGYSEVYKGCLKSGQLVAVKRLTKGTADEKTAGFLSELGIIAHVDHPNAAKLIGCCVEGGMYLVFELSSLGSLGSLLHSMFMICGFLFLVLNCLSVNAFCF